LEVGTIHEPLIVNGEAKIKKTEHEPERSLRKKKKGISLTNGSNRKKQQKEGKEE